MAKIVDAEQKRAHIVDATYRVVAEHGLDLATMRMIAAEAGCTTGMVTHYFANKDEILEALVQEVSRRANRRMTAALEHEPGLAGLRSLLLHSLPLDNTRAAEWRIWLALWNKSASGGKPAAEWTRRERGWMSLLRHAVERAIEFGDLPDEARRDTVLETLSALSYGLSVGALLSPSRLGPRLMVGIVDEFLDRQFGATPEYPPSNAGRTAS